MARALGFGSGVAPKRRGQSKPKPKLIELTKKLLAVTEVFTRSGTDWKEKTRRGWAA